MDKLGRNESCSCLSGKKFKNCCINNNEMLDFFKGKLNAQYIDGNFMVRSLCENSILLREYLNAKIPEFKHSVYWLVNPSQDVNIRSIGIGDEHAIILKKIPIDNNDYFDLAYEIGHLLFSEQRYPLANIKDKDSRKTYLASILMNTVADPKINKDIINYGFDFIPHIKKSIDIQIPIINSYANEDVLHLFDKHYLKCLLIEKLLEWDFLVNDMVNPYAELFKSNYPIMYQEALEDTRFIRELGTDTSEKVKVIFNKLLEENMMRETIEII
ncbi:MAG: YecA family protein [Acetobacterium sp.]